MKQISTKLSIMMAIFLPVLAFSQNKIESKSKSKKDQINIRIEKEIDGKKEVFEKKIDASNMTSQQREEAVQKIQDSLMAGEKGTNHRLKIEIADDDMEMKGGNINEDRDVIIDRDVIVKKMPKNRQYHYKYYNNDDNFDGKWEQKLDRGLDNMGKHLDKLGYDIDRRIKVYKDKATKKSPKIHGLEVYPNNPKAEVLNINFKAPDRGDVSIRVLDVKGNVVAKEDVKDFSGEYVGQINIGKAGKGTYFVMVTQNEDGITKRVVIGGQE